MSDCAKTAGKIFLRELLVDEFSFSSHTKDNIPLQTRKLFIASLIRHGLDWQLVDVHKWYPTTLPPATTIFSKIRELDEAEKKYRNCPIMTKKLAVNIAQSRFNNLTDEVDDIQNKNTPAQFTSFINIASIKFIEKTLSQITGKKNYVSIKQVPIVTAYDVASMAVTGIRCHAFLKKDPRETIHIMAETFVLNKMLDVEQSICKRILKKACKNSATIKSVNKWFTKHPTITRIPKLLVDFLIIPKIIYPYNRNILQKLQIR